MRVRQHRAADELTHGVYWEERGEHWVGCGVGCTIHSSDHMAYEDELGIPCRLAYLEDHLYEHLPVGQSLEWPEAFLSSIAIGADLSHVIDQFLIWLLVDEEVGVIQFGREYNQRVIKQVAALYQQRLAGETITEDAWLDTRRATSTFGIIDDNHDAALAAAGYAALAAEALGAVADAACAAAQAFGRAALESYVDVAAFGTADAYVAYADIWNTPYIRMAEKLLELLASAPVSAEA